MKFFFFIAVFIVAGCASLGPSFTTLQPAPKTQALIYVYRPSAYSGVARSPDIVLNGKKIGSISSGGYFSVEVDAGPSKVVMRSFAGEESGEFAFTLKPNQTYFLRVDLSSPTLKERHNSSGKSTGEKCPFMGLNMMLPVSKEEIVNLLRSMDQRIHSDSCWAGFMFVVKDLADKELPHTKLIVSKK